MFDEVMDTEVRFRTTSDNTGADAAAQAVRRVGAEATDAGAKTATSAKQMTEGFRTATESTETLHGGMRGIGRLAAELGSRFPNLAAAIAPAGMMAAAFLSWKKVYDTIVEIQHEHEKMATDNAISNMAGHVKMLSTAYENLQHSINATFEEQDHFLQSQKDLKEAVHTLTLAQLDSAEQKELTGVTDPQQQAAIKARYDSQRASSKASYDTFSAQNKLEMDDAALGKAMLNRQAANDVLSDDYKMMGSYQRQDASLAEAQRKAMNSARNGLGGSIAEGNEGERYQGERETLAKNMAELAEEMKKAREDRDKAGDDFEKYRASIAANQMRLKAAQSTGDTSTGKTSQAELKADASALPGLEQKLGIERAQYADVSWRKGNASPEAILIQRQI